MEEVEAGSLGVVCGVVDSTDVGADVDSVTEVEASAVSAGTADEAVDVVESDDEPHAVDSVASTRAVHTNFIHPAIWISRFCRRHRGPYPRMPNHQPTVAPMPVFTPSHLAPSAASAHRYFHVVGTLVWVTESLLDEAWSAHFLGMLGDEACWGVDVPDGHDPADGAALDLYSFFGTAGETEWMVAGRAVQLVEWARTHRFCGRCGTPTSQQLGERAMRCPSCGLLAFPRLAPAMITLVSKDDQALLARGVQFRSPLYSCLAGFVEPGESLEGAVVREVREEVGIEVQDVRYWGSQPWPFPHSLMVGFTAKWKSGEIDIDPTEIVDARWFRRDELPAIPPPISIARKLIDAWLADSL